MKHRAYTGTSDGVAKGRRAGMIEFIKQMGIITDGALWNNGDFGVRDIKGKAGQLSVHATGRACDLSYRHMPNHKDASNTKGKPEGRKHALEACRIMVKNADLLQIEMIIDYFPEPHGRAWKCDRNGWVKYDRHMVSGSPGGDWLHVELSPAMADDAVAVRSAFKQISEQMANG